VAQLRLAVIAQHIIQSAKHAFDDFAKSGGDREANRGMLGLSRRASANAD